MENEMVFTDEVVIATCANELVVASLRKTLEMLITDGIKGTTTIELDMDVTQELKRKIVDEAYEKMAQVMGVKVENVEDVFQFEIEVKGYGE